MAEELSEERKLILQNRRELRKAKKAKAKQFKEQNQQARREKKAEIVAKIRAKREEAQSNGNSSEDGCWLCGETTHRKQDCPNRAAGDLNKTCFQCRRRGHTSHNCPQNGKGGFGQHQQQAAVCFNCGADDHALRDCPKPMENGGATYATCFVCGQQGHLSSKCPQNKMGVYPKGGCCKVCKSVEHLARDCPVGNISVDGSSGEKKNKKTIFADDDEDYVDTGDKTGDALDSFQLGLDGEDDDGDTQEESKKSSRTHPKRVKF
ncbi:hypothetical protein PI124_g11544 [Phytophthora idaei]|nr:hypothetical protein PI125_g18305 [Phytophthora idaei]KAG3152539.1 hypothetical protein PI126_g10461 [Phytophthora idaei]KAG3243654.1 hypothetical protein PI124_g11544 [Phytophthora idaei]